ncbi:MAG: hypothetical protein R2867_29165 [Caldilineaceae bacterium]
MTDAAENANPEESNSSSGTGEKLTKRRPRKRGTSMQSATVAGTEGKNTDADSTVKQRAPQSSTPKRAPARGEVPNSTNKRRARKADPAVAETTDDATVASGTNKRTTRTSTADPSPTAVTGTAKGTARKKKDPVTAEKTLEAAVATTDDAAVASGTRKRTTRKSTADPSPAAVTGTGKRTTRKKKDPATAEETLETAVTAVESVAPATSAVDEAQKTTVRTARRGRKKATETPTAQPVAAPASEPPMAKTEPDGQKAVTEPARQRRSPKKADSKPAAVEQSTTNKKTDGKRSTARRTNDHSQARANRKTASDGNANTTNRSSSRSGRSAPTRTTQRPDHSPKRTLTAPRAGSEGRRLATSDGTRALSLRNDLQKYLRESYRQDDFTNGVQLILEAGAGGTLRDVVSAVLRSRGSFGGMLSEHAIEGLMDKLTDNYRKRKVAERKAMRAVINWCSGLVAPEKDLEGQLLMEILNTDDTGSTATGG